MSAYLVSESRVMSADARTIFDIVADPAMHPVMDGSGSVRAVQGSAPARLSLGATFGMDMKLGAAYKITNEVVEFEEGHRIGWRHFNGHVWRYLFEPVDGGTRVTEQWDARQVWNKLALRIARFPARNRAGIVATLENLDRLATTRA